MYDSISSQSWCLPLIINMEISSGRQMDREMGKGRKFRTTSRGSSIIFLF